MMPATPSAAGLHRKVLDSEAGQDLGRCVACGTCSSGCPVHAQRPEFDPRKIVRMVLMGLEGELFESGMIWLCSTCYSCLERCPQEVGCARIITELRNLAAGERGLVAAEGGASVPPTLPVPPVLPEAFSLQMDALRRFGRVYEIEEFDNKKREKLGLAVLETKAPIEPLIPAGRAAEGAAEAVPAADPVAAGDPAAAKEDLE